MIFLSFIIVSVFESDMLNYLVLLINFSGTKRFGRAPNKCVLLTLFDCVMLSCSGS